MINIDQIIKEMDLEGNPSNHRVVVAMSGGVDSSVTAALLVEAGFEVVGLTMQLYDYGKALQKKGACCAGSDINDARLVSSKLGIPHYVLDYESIFQDQVINDFADSYLRGETPIPCVKCNQTVKFKDLFVEGLMPQAHGVFSSNQDSDYFYSELSLLRDRIDDIASRLENLLTNHGSD